MLHEGPFEGGCFCGAIRYRFIDVFDAGYCHCSICRRTTGAPMIAWVNTPAGGFAITRGAPRMMESSERFERAFCGDCGTILYTQARLAGTWEYVSVHHGTIDDCERIRPAIHICYADRLSWLDVRDDLPRVDDNTLTHPDKR